MEASTNHRWSNIFNNADFYPTPPEVLAMMQINTEGENILEPSAGKGNIIDYLKEHNAKDVLFCEINEDLANICKMKARFLKHDFLKVTAEEISHVTQIVMNPPFSTSKAHLQHAWNIAPDGCEITSLFNSSTLHDLRYSDRELKHIIEDHGNSFELGNVFNESERKTNVNVSLVKLYKPIRNENNNFEGFYMDDEPEERCENGIMQYNDIKALVNSYIGAAKCFDEFSIVNAKMQRLCAPVGFDRGFSYSIEYNKQTASKEEFLKALQKESWKYIFKKMNLSKYLTSGVMEDVNKFVENQTKVPFTVKNIYRMFDIIVGTKEHNFNKALEQAIDSFTKHTHENRFGVEGWKTNSGYMLNKKFIIDYVFEVAESWHGENAGKLKVRYSSRNNQLDDLTKVICNITGFDYNKTRSLSQFADSFKYLTPNQWYENGFFRFKGFKKGTIHIEFVDSKIWEQLNRAYAKIKGQVLPETVNFGNKEEKKQTEQKAKESAPKQNTAAVKEQHEILLSELFN
jgi:hypothetical protein